MASMRQIDWKKQEREKGDEWEAAAGIWRGGGDQAEVVGRTEWTSWLWGASEGRASRTCCWGRCRSECGFCPEDLHERGHR